MLRVSGSSCLRRSWTRASYLITASLPESWPDNTRGVGVTHSSGDLDYYMCMSECVCV